MRSLWSQASVYLKSVTELHICRQQWMQSVQCAYFLTLMVSVYWICRLFPYSVVTNTKFSWKIHSSVYALGFIPSRLHRNISLNISQCLCVSCSSYQFSNLLACFRMRHIWLHMFYLAHFCYKLIFLMYYPFDHSDSVPINLPKQSYNCHTDWAGYI